MAQVDRTGMAITKRQRFTVAQVSAGATILAALPGVKYRLIDAVVIAIGGAVTTVTTIDILGILSTSSRKLVAFSQAQLTQSTVLRPGITGATVLADGASYTPNDVNTAITINITGSAITVATSIDVILTYAAERG